MPSYLLKKELTSCGVWGVWIPCRAPPIYMSCRNRLGFGHLCFKMLPTLRQSRSLHFNYMKALLKEMGLATKSQGQKYPEPSNSKILDLQTTREKKQQKHMTSPITPRNPCQDILMAQDIVSQLLKPCRSHARIWYMLAWAVLLFGACMTSSMGAGEGFRPVGFRVSGLGLRVLVIMRGRT